MMKGIVIRKFQEITLIKNQNEQWNSNYKYSRNFKKGTEIIYIYFKENNLTFVIFKYIGRNEN